MAYMTADGQGPCPNKAGEYCGNHNPQYEPICCFHETPGQARQNERAWLSDKRFGKPHSCEAGTSEEMAAKGYVGLYLIEDCKWKLRDGAYEIPTPPELMEPGCSPLANMTNLEKRVSETRDNLLRGIFT